LGSAEPKQSEPLFLSHEPNEDAAQKAMHDHGAEAAAETQRTERRAEKYARRHRLILYRTAGGRFALGDRDNAAGRWPHSGWVSLDEVLGFLTRKARGEI
jgi:hypothetical protein